jgi:hypothetical protein
LEGKYQDVQVSALKTYTRASQLKITRIIWWAMEYLDEVSFYHEKNTKTGTKMFHSFARSTQYCVNFCSVVHCL